MKQFFKRHLVTIILLTILFGGLCLLLYPTVSNWWNSYHQSKAVAAYVETIENMDEEESGALLAEAQAYNEEIAANGIRWQLTDEELQEYESILDVSGTGIMGYVEIPSIDVKLPIYHGTSDAVLQIAVGHIEGSSLPVGGESTHCVLSGHRGLPSARLFTDLDEVVEGDVFTITVLKEVLTYEVDQIRIVLPDELEDLKIEEGEDLCTLVTCTPYGVNSHRLLVRGHRIATVAEQEVTREATQISPIYVAAVLAGVMLVLILIGMLVRGRLKKRRAKRTEKTKTAEEPETAEKPAATKTKRMKTIEESETTEPDETKNERRNE